MRRRGFLSGLAGSAGLAALGAPLGAAPLDKLRETGVVRMALYNANRPWSWDDNGKPAGIDVDIAKAIAADLKLRPEIVLFMADESVSDDLRNTVWRGGLLGFQACDVMLHVPFDPAFARTEDNVVFVAPYYRETFGAVCSPQTKNCDAPPQLFVGKTVAAEMESIPDIYLMGSFGGVLRSDVKHFADGYAAASAVHEGEADFAVATRAQIEAAAKDHPDQRAQMRKSPLPLLPSSGWDIGMAVKEDSRSLGFAIEEAVEAMVADGRMAAIFAAHGVAWQHADAAKVAS